MHEKLPGEEVFRSRTDGGHSWLTNRAHDLKSEKDGALNVPVGDLLELAASLVDSHTSLVRIIQYAIQLRYFFRLQARLSCYNDETTIAHSLIVVITECIIHNVTSSLNPYLHNFKLFFVSLIKFHRLLQFQNLSKTSMDCPDHFFPKTNICTGWNNKVLLPLMPTFFFLRPHVMAEYCSGLK